MKPFSKLRRHLILYLILIVIVPVAVVGTVTLKNLYENRIDMSVERIVKAEAMNLEDLELGLQQKIELVEHQLGLISKISDMDLVRSLLQRTQLSDFGLAGQAYFNDSDGAWVTVGTPVFSETIKSSVFSNSESMTFIDKYVYVFGRMNGKVLISVYLTESLFQEAHISEFVQTITYRGLRIFEAPEERMAVDQRNQSKLLGSVLPLEVTILVDRSDLMRQLNRSWIATAGLAALGAGALILAIILFVAMRLKPFERILASINLLLKGHYAIRLPNRGTREQGEIIDVFNEMAHRIDERMSEHKERLEEVLQQNKQLKEATTMLNQSIREMERSKEELSLRVEKNEILINKFDQVMIRFDAEGHIQFMNEYGMKKLGIEDYSNLTMQNLIKFHDESDSLHDLVMFLNKYETNQLQLEFMNFKTHYSDTLLVSNRHLTNAQGEQEVQMIGKEVSMAYVVERSLKQIKMEYEILDDINFDEMKFSQIDEYFQKISEKLFQLLDPVEVTILHVNQGTLEKVNSISTIKQYQRFDGKPVEGSVFESVIEGKEPLEIRNARQSIRDFNPYYEMRSIADIFNHVYIHPLVINQEVTDIILLISDRLYPKNHLDIVRTIVNHLNLAVERVRLVESLKNSGIQMIKTLLTTIEAKDPYTIGHSERVAAMSKYLAQKMGHSDEFTDEIYLAGLLHDIGKLGIEDRILAKEGRLTLEEYDKIKKHPSLGYQILKSASFSVNVLETALYHHKQYDLQGYPVDGLDKLPPMSAIVGVADAVDAVVTDRSYNAVGNIDQAIEELEKYSGTQFDPAVAQVAMEEMRSNRRFFEEILIDGGQNELPCIVSEISS